MSGAVLKKPQSRCFTTLLYPILYSALSLGGLPVAQVHILMWFWTWHVPLFLQASDSHRETSENNSYKKYASLIGNNEERYQIILQLISVDKYWFMTGHYRDFASVSF